MSSLIFNVDIDILMMRSLNSQNQTTLFDRKD